MKIPFVNLLMHTSHATSPSELQLLWLCQTSYCTFSCGICIDLKLLKVPFTCKGIDYCMQYSNQANINIPYKCISMIEYKLLVCF